MGGNEEGAECLGLDRGERAKGGGDSFREMGIEE